MDVALYVRRGRKAPQVLRFAEELGLPYVLDLSRESFDKSPYLHAVELEEELRTLPGTIVFPYSDDFYKYVAIADLLNVKRLVMPPPPSIEGLQRIYEEAAVYSVEVRWLYGYPPLARPADVERVAEVVHPRAAKIVYDVAKARSNKEIIHSLVRLQGYIASIYLSNKSGSKSPRLPPFDPRGVINYVDVIQAALLLQWDGQYVLRMAPEYADRAPSQLSIMREVEETFRNTGRASKKVQRMVASVLNEIFSQSGLE